MFMKLLMLVLSLVLFALLHAPGDERVKSSTGKMEKASNHLRKGIELKCNQGFGIRLEIPEFSGWPLKSQSVDQVNGRLRWVAQLEVPTHLEERILQEFNASPGASTKKFAVRAWVSIERHRWPKEESDTAIGDSRVDWGAFTHGSRPLRADLQFRKESVHTAWLFLKPYAYLVQVELPVAEGQDAAAGSGFSLTLFWDTLLKSVRPCR
jgi:hypothetical protein